MTRGAITWRISIFIHTNFVNQTLGNQSHTLPSTIHPPFHFQMFYSLFKNIRSNHHEPLVLNFDFHNNKSRASFSSSSVMFLKSLILKSVLNFLFKSSIESSASNFNSA